MSDDVQLIKDKIDVAELVGEYVQLKPSGVNKKGLCPFHNEKTPSFMVNSERQSWHCFGCGKGGDIFSFVEEMEGMEFKEALKYLADKAGVKLVNNFRQEVDSSQRNRIKDINTEAAKFFHNFLLKMPVSKPALEYLQNRGVKNGTTEEWQIGYISEQWDLLTQYLLKKGYGLEDLVAAGLTIKKENADPGSGRGFYDRFRGRIMFPIWNVHGEVVGFTGRILVEKPDFAKAAPGKENFTPGKYVNTPQTAVYDKSRVIYGLNKAKQEIRTKDLIVLVEGQMDVIACHQAGMKNVVATSGTAFTDEQIKLLGRYSKNLNIAFDLDSAGLAAAEKYAGPALRAGNHVVLTMIPSGLGKDADECIKKDKNAYFEAVKNAEDFMQWYLYKVSFGRDINNSREKELLADEFLGSVAQLSSAITREHWLEKLSEKVNIEKNILRERMIEIKKKGEKKEVKVLASKTGESTSVLAVYSKLDSLAENLLVILLRYPTLFAECRVALPEEILSTGKYGSVYKALKKEYDENSSIDIERLRQAVNLEKSENIVDILLLKGEWEFSNISATEAKSEIQNVLGLIKTEWTKKRRRELQTEIEKAEKAGETEKVKSLLAEFGNLGN